MLLAFALENFRSYRRRMEFSLVASRLTELPGHLVPVVGLDLSVLRAAALYGANASGKSNLFEAAWFLGDLIERGPDAFGGQGESRAPCFALDPKAKQQPTAFEVNFFVRDNTYPDGVRFEYRIAFRERRIEEEWLNAYPVGGRQQRWFVRGAADGSVADVRFSTALKGEHSRLKRVTPPGAPYLWVAEKFGHGQLSVPARWLKRNFADHVYDPLDFPQGATARLCQEEPTFRQWASDFLRYADLGIVDVRSERRQAYSEQTLSQFAPRFRERLAQSYRYDVTFLHRTAGKPVPLDMEDESSGTERLFDLLGPVWQALREGKVLFLDEMSASMHPLLTQRLIEAFQDASSNPKAAQLVLTTHDVSLLRTDLFRRDEIWFAEKNEKGETDLYSLHDFQPRGDASLAKNYLAGRYGAIPFMGNFQFGADDGTQEEAGEKENPRKRSKRQADGRAEKAGPES